jgi:site-specific DNA-cytosine methylase
MYLSIPSKSAPAWECLARDYAPGSPEWASTLASAATLNGKHTQPQSWQRAWKKALDAAPVWSDILTFDAAAWAGAVDCVVAGFPCQDLSLAGRRAGLDGKRSGLFFDILDIAHACGARYLFLENVAGIASATASVVDEAEGALDERAAARVLGELADRGWHAEWLTLSASDVGASHGRERWFCWAWRDVADSDCDGLRTGGRSECEPCDAQPRRDDVDDTQRAERRATWIS